jgi:enoyl-CoA hydratase
MTVLFEREDNICIITMDRAHAKNAIDVHTANELVEAFHKFEADDSLSVAILTGSNGTFCAGADLKALAQGEGNQLNIDMSKDGPLGPSRMQFKKPVIAAIAGYAVAGGLELACLCDLRVLEEDAILGVFCRRFGVPLVDGGTQRLPRLIGLSRALDLILTGRPVQADEAYQMGLANRVVPNGKALSEAKELAKLIAGFPQQCMLNDREATIKGMDLDFHQGLQLEFLLGLSSIQSGETFAGANEFLAGKGRHGKF